MFCLLFCFGFRYCGLCDSRDYPVRNSDCNARPDAEKLNEYIVKYDPYRAWELWPKKGKLYKGTEPHGALLTTFVNNTAHFSIKKKKGMEDGSIIAKENYTADKKFVALSVMYKIKGYNPAAGDWSLGKI